MWLAIARGGCWAGRCIARVGESARARRTASEDAPRGCMQRGSARGRLSQCRTFSRGPSSAVGVGRSKRPPRSAPAIEWWKLRTASTRDRGHTGEGAKLLRIQPHHAATRPSAARQHRKPQHRWPQCSMPGENAGGKGCTLRCNNHPMLRSTGGQGLLLRRRHEHSALVTEQHDMRTCCSSAGHWAVDGVRPPPSRPAKAAQQHADAPCGNGGRLAALSGRARVGFRLGILVPGAGVLHPTVQRARRRARPRWQAWAAARSRSGRASAAASFVRTGCSENEAPSG
ncbi:hypothetical protein BD413DRAFT_65554 [Trametes elegans]|nr:hypothetical protein BD413DRAFT_65554 [Trametes elegans]